mmetsp:Transcript_7720/g.21414  ORF Transcript_7720/g.21414 Transcript_7720/m.21414 type:complete len:203 (-) Transcript_7720:372-980(-)
MAHECVKELRRFLLANLCRAIALLTLQHQLLMERHEKPALRNRARPEANGDLDGEIAARLLLHHSQLTEAALALACSASRSSIRSPLPASWPELLEEHSPPMSTAAVHRCRAPQCAFACQGRTSHLPCHVSKAIIGRVQCGSLECGCKETETANHCTTAGAQGLWVQQDGKSHLLGSCGWWGLSLMEPRWKCKCFPASGTFR